MTAFLLLMVSCSTEEGAKSWYVSADGGSDNNPGTLKRPFQTLAKAAESAGAGDICYIREGTYREVLRPKQSGNAGMPVTFTSYENEQVIISCMETLSGWEKDAGEVYRCAVPWNLGQDNMVMADGRVCTLARWPDEVDGDPFTLNSLRNTGGSMKEVKKDAWLEYGGIPDWPWDEGGSLFFFGDDKGCGWIAWRSFITTTEKDRVYCDLPSSWVGSYHAPGAGGEFFLQGIREALDHDYEWYMDKEDMLYLQLPGGRQPADGEVSLRKRKQAIDLGGLEYIVVKDLAVIGGSIDMDRGASHNVLSGITSYYGSYTAGVMDHYLSGSQSLMIDGDENHVERCELAYGSGSGIYVKGDGNVIEDCLVHDFDYLGSYDGPVIMRHGSGSKLLRNTIYNAGRDGIQFFHKDSEVAYNDVSRTNLINHDCGPIYTLGGPYHSEIHHNWFHDVGGRGDLYKGCGIYLDNSSVAFSVHHNVVWNTRWSSIQINLNATDIEIYNNTFWNGSETMGWWRPRAGEALSLKEDTHFRNVKVFNNLANEGTWDPECILENNMTLDDDPFVNSVTGDFRPTRDLGQDVGAYAFGGEFWKAGISWDPEKGPAGHGHYGLLKSQQQ